MNIRETLPIHTPASDEILSNNKAGYLDVCGLVRRPHLFTPVELGALPRAQLAERFVCEEGWAIERLTWEGIRLSEALALCDPTPEACFVHVCAGSYWLALSLNDLDQVVLCDTLNGEPLSREHGAPWRLVCSGGACFTSVKWVSTLKLAADAGAPTAEQIARGRLA